MTHIFDRLATVKAGVVPACSSWPGVISFSTRVPAMGERMAPSTWVMAWPCWIALTTLGSMLSAVTARSAASRSASALAASVWAWAFSRAETPLCWARSLSASATWRFVLAVARALA